MFSCASLVVDSYRRNCGLKQRNPGDAWYLALDVVARPGEGECLLLVCSADAHWLPAERVA